MKSFKLLTIPALCVTLVACGGGAAGGGESISNHSAAGVNLNTNTWTQGNDVQGPDGSWRTTAIQAEVNGLVTQLGLTESSGLRTGQLANGNTVYYRNKQEIQRSEYYAADPDALNTVQTNPKLGFSNVTGLSTNTQSLPSISPFNNDISSAWAKGYFGRGNIGAINTGSNSAEVTTALSILTQQVAPSPNVTSDITKPFDIALSFDAQYTAVSGTLGVDYNHLKNDGLLVASQTYLNSAKTYFDLLPAGNQEKARYSTYTDNNLLAVKAGPGVGTEYGVIGATNQSEAVAVAGGYASIVMSKFTGLTASQAGTLLKKTSVPVSVTSAGAPNEGYNLSLVRALSPTGNLR